MADFRVIARLDVKSGNLIKGIHLEGLRVLGDPAQFAQKYYEEGIDEIIYMDPVASLYGRNSLKDVVEKTARKVFVPLTVGGGVRSIDDAAELFRVGADKVAINTAAIENPALIANLAAKFGSQAVVLSVEAKRKASGWEAFINCGRDATGICVVEWCKKATALGAGEILLTSVDQEGTGAGFDRALCFAVSSAVDVPVIISGGYGAAHHLTELVEACSISGIAIADALHYKKDTVKSVKYAAMVHGITVREL